MRYIIIFIAFVFTLLGLTSNLSSNPNQNILNSYFLYAVSFIGKHLIIFTFSFIVVSFFVLKSLKFEKKHPIKNKVLIITTQTLFMFITAIFASFISLIIIAIIQLNVLSYFSNINPKILGIQSDTNKIKTYLIANAQPPSVIASDDNSFNQLQSIGAVTTGTDNFYGKYVIPSIPNFLVLPTQKLNPILLMDKTLIISGSDKKSLETISPVLSYLFLKSYFSDRPIKHYPKIYILNESEHIDFRKKDFARKLTEIQQQSRENETRIASSSALIDGYNQKLNSDKDLITNTYSKRDKEYNACIAKGEYVSGTFVKTNSKSYCDLQVLSLNKLIDDTNTDIDITTKALADESSLLKEYQAYDVFFKNQGKLTDALKTNIPEELGLYTPPDSIRIIIDTKSPHAIADYLETASHEYLHYTSHLDKKSFKTLFFEEGLTEYFARNAIKNSLNLDTNMGFPVFVKIIDQISKMIPDTELADIYFSKDETQVATVLDRVYGDNFYKNNLVYFEALPYTSNTKQLLQIANKIMNKIGGPVLKDEDLYSTESRL